MNRRNFIGNILTATAGFTILPGAGRIWVAKQEFPGWTEVDSALWNKLPIYLAKTQTFRLRSTWSSLCSPQRQAITDKTLYVPDEHNTISH